MPPTGEPIAQWLDATQRLGATDLHLSARRPPTVRVAGRLLPLEGEAPLEPEEIDKVVREVLADMAHRIDEQGDVDFSFGWRDQSRFRGNVYWQRGTGLARAASHPVRDPHARRARPAAGARAVPRRGRRPRDRHRPDGLREVDDARQHGRPDQPAPQLPHHHARGADRVRALARRGDGQPARGRHRHGVVPRRAARRAARRPRRAARRRDARPREHPDHAHDRRDRPPRVRDAAHQRHRAGDRPHRRRVPSRAAPAGAAPARGDAPGRRLPAAAAHAATAAGRSRRSR